jgi:hypothetical protein
MMDLQTIRELSEESARAAEEYGKEPMVFRAEQLECAKNGDLSAISGIPDLGTYLPRGWSRVTLKDGPGVYSGDNEGAGAFFVDSSGFGQRGEPALTISEFIEQLKPGLGYGIVSVGQFQVKIGAFAVRTDIGLRK